ncbi:MAG TPA: hypothetical protein GXZ43_00300 [Clostridiaceae bacterium]|nr:hypothetical protein [Clostridiaceae bacterium]
MNSDNLNGLKSFIIKRLNLLKNKIRAEEANTSLFFLILLPITVMVLFLTFENVQLRREELDFVRSCETSLDLALADYDRQLWQEFGLWGVESNLLNQHKNEMEQNFVSDRHEVEIEISGIHNLEDTEQLRKQILRHMSVRSPFLAIEEIIKRIGNVGIMSEQLNNSSVLAEITSKSNLVDPEFIIANPDSAAGDLASLDVEIKPEDQETLEEMSNSELNTLSESSLEILAKLIEEAKTMIVPMYESTGNPVPANPLAPGSLQNITNFFDQFLLNYDIPIISRLQIQEYMLNYYPMQVTELEMSGNKTPLQTPDGRLHSDLHASGRKNEVEQIIFNTNDPDSAASKAKWGIRGICFTYHLIDNFTDEAKQSVYLLQATGISTAIAVVSIGHIVIDPQTLVYTITLIDSLSQAFADSDQLLAGEELTFPIGDLEININYRDLMRVFTLFKNEDNLLSGINNMRKKTVPGNFITAIKLDGCFRNSSICLSREYSDFIIKKP